MKYYAYVYFDNQIPFYVGKGSNDRSNDHIRKIKSNSSFGNKGFENKLRTLFDEDKMPVIKRYYCETEEEAFELEKFLITQIGRIDLGTGPLFNLTDGGYGTNNYIMTDEHKNIISKSNSERKISEKVIENFAGWNKGISHTEETKEKISSSNKGKKRTPEQIERYRQAALNRSDEHKAKIKESKSKSLINSLP